MNFIARTLLGNFIRKRLTARSGGRRGRGRGRYPTAFSRPRGRQLGRSRGRRQVRVGGCCLPIPLGGLTITALAASRRLRPSGR